MKKIPYSVLLLLLFGSFVTAQEIDFNDFLNETQISSNDPDAMSMVWWLPTEFWEISFAQDENMSEAEINEFLNTLEPYSIFGVVDGKIGAFGGINYEDEEVISQSISVTNQHGKVFKPVNPNELSPDVNNLLMFFKPFFSNMMGDLGNNLNFYVFKDYESGKRLFNPQDMGELSVSFNDKTLKIETPIGSLLPKKKCPVDGKEMNGAWQFCPWHGDKLTE